MDSDINKRLTEVRVNLGLTKKEFADRLAIASTVIVDIENGKREPSKNILLTVAAEYSISLNWLCFGIGPKNLPSKIPSLPANVETAKVPLLRQKVSCGPGQDWESENNIIDYIDIFNISRVKINRLFALRVEGSSMIGAGIQSGDYVLFDGATDQRVRDGLYVFSLDGEVFCKRLEFDMNKIKIYSVRHVDLDKADLMRTLDTEDIDTADRLTIFGRVLYWLHPYDDTLHKA